MSVTAEWTKEVYEASVSSRCWFFTPYDGGNWSPGVAKDDELREIVFMEMALEEMPDWACRIVEGCMYHVGACGHYRFPTSFLEVVDAIGKETPPHLAHGCFTVEGGRKRAALDYCFCLDAWLAGASAEEAATELSALGFRKIDWHGVCADIWDVLGERTETNRLLVERVLHQVRWSVKFTVWDDDRGTEFCRDEYLGGFSKGDHGADILAYYETPTGRYEKQCPRLQKTMDRLGDLLGDDWQAMRSSQSWWLCAPKAFRFLERQLWGIGKGRPPQPGEKVPGFLRCEDTYPDKQETSAWWFSFLEVLDGWWRQHPVTGPVADDVNARLGEATPVKCWLVRLFARRLRRLEENGEEFSRLVSGPHCGKG